MHDAMRARSNVATHTLRWSLVSTATNLNRSTTLLEQRGSKHKGRVHTRQIKACLLREL